MVRNSSPNQLLCHPEEAFFATACSRRGSLPAARSAVEGNTVSVDPKEGLSRKAWIPKSQETLERKMLYNPYGVPEKGRR
jgi:hypothetical protein